MSEKYTPDETELRDCYAASLHEHAGEDYTTAKADAERGIAKIRADALREAAEESEQITCEGHGGNDWFPSEWAEQVAGWLEHRADQIEEEA